MKSDEYSKNSVNDSNFTESDLRFRSQILTHLLNNSYDAIFILDRSEGDTFRIVEWNVACEKFVGHSKASVMNKFLHEIFTGDLIVEFDKRFKECIQARKPISVENLLHFPAGQGYLKATLIPMFDAKGDVQSIIGVGHNLTDRYENELNLRRLNGALLALSRAGGELARAKTIHELFTRCCESIVNENQFYVAACIEKIQGLSKMTKEACAIKETHFATFKQYEINNQENTVKRTITDAARILQPQVKKITIENVEYIILAIPLNLRANECYMFTLMSSHPNAFDDQEINIFLELAKDLYYNASNLILQEKYDESVQSVNKKSEKLNIILDETIKSFSTLSEKRDPYTAGHQQRVSHLCVEIGKRADLNEKQLKSLELAALIHDIGKILIPAAILTKPTRLSFFEYGIIKEHPRSGYDILCKIEFDDPIAEIVHQHHEYLDGSGYPQGLKGDAILIESRILTVADIVEAMSSHRPYRAGRSIEMTLSHIMSMRGIQLEPRIVDICIDLFNNGYQFPKYNPVENNINKEDTFYRD